MLVIPPPKFRKRSRLVRRRPRSQAPVVALTLVAAAYDDVGLTVTLTFDRAVDVGGFDGAQVIVEDSATNLMRYAATGAVAQPTATQVRAGLVGLEPFADPYGVFLQATAGSGIVAADDGGTWAGASGLELPWP